MGKACGNIVDKYKNTEHNATKTKPLDAAKKENIYRWICICKAMLKKDKKYPKINEGDMVRVNLKKELTKVMNRIGVQRGIK